MDNLVKAEQIAKDRVKEIKESQDLAKAKAEPKKETESTEAVKKTEGTNILDTAEKQAEDNARILSAKDEELSVEDKARKVELVKAKAEKEKKEETPEEAEKRIKESTQKRIDEIIGELKAEKAERKQDKERIAELEAKLNNLTQPKVEEDKATKVKQLFTQQVSKHLEEDKDKPREQKREMPKEELEEWLLEDYVSATEWLTDRNIRRNEEKANLILSLDEAPRLRANEFIQQQQESLKKLAAKYPSVVPSPERLAQLKGKTTEEIDEILASENADYKMMLEIARSDPKKYLGSVDGPEQVMAEMDKRKAKSNKTITLTEEELNRKINEAAVIEAQRIAGLDEGISSSGGRKMQKQENKSQLRLKQEEIARKAGISMDSLDSAIKRRESMGISTATAEEFNKD